MGMVIETKRLKIIVLTQEQLEMLVDNIPEFEKRLNCSYQGEKIEGIFKNILYEQSLKIEANSDVYLWLTFWLIVKKDDNIAVGMIDFKNIPNENREVEIGYGLGKKHEHFGYMTEAVEAFCTFIGQHIENNHVLGGVIKSCQVHIGMSLVLLGTILNPLSLHQLSNRRISLHKNLLTEHLGQGYFCGEPNQL